MARPTDRYWTPYPVRPSGGSRYDTLPIAEEEEEQVAKRERERRARGFGFAPIRDEHIEALAEQTGTPATLLRDAWPLLWEGDQA